MTSRINGSSGTVWEQMVGYSRVVRTGNVVHVSGTTALDETGNFVGFNDPYVQTMQILVNIERALSQVNATLAHVVRTRIYLADMDTWQEVARAHAEVFSQILPATTMVEVSRLIDSRMMVEMEAEAWVD